MPGVMDIKHLLCHPCDPYSSLLEKKQEENLQINTNTLYEQVEFWKHSRSNSTQSISSCSSQSSVYRSRSPSPSPAVKHRRRVNSEICRRTVSSGDFIITSPQQLYHQNTRRNRSNSASYIQTRTPWSPEEDGLLRKGYEQGLSWAMISCTYLPHRSRGCCWGRFKTLQSKNVMEVYQQRICQRPWKISSPKGDKKKV
ncbi:hypothetical protein MFLAVUS_004517 [Mucor flavus]|uniref:Myb-like domain-containing protein n=1 Tax=Mucor flavus TaxID=439312 RepID=A0ABP9YW43_9FUNG